MGFLQRLQHKPRHVKAQFAFVIAALSTACVAFVWMTVLPARFEGGDEGQAAAPAAAEETVTPEAPVVQEQPAGAYTLPTAPGPQLGERQAPQAVERRPVQIGTESSSASSTSTTP